eukprot:CAMPEP_0181314302 /NCGR_PEP_ID=MMETSP1101-20121128/14740_1 /TAXON_ID=46948 /ORGANISM="Rhodomonas abbreviata, Strain Caron Lab Isolate" /LENGTH=416 /DNA_ID=CAMNT_0023421375 /DNA_START=97 /DNA_END=1344 /DNA_ORIENTATION=+
MTRQEVAAIQVCVRVRPAFDASASESVQCTSNEVKFPACPPMRFDKVFNGASTQEEIFGSLKNLIEPALSGYKSTIFAYGQTGSGKTHTMLGENGGLSICATKMGLIPRCSRFLFSRIADTTQAEPGAVQFQVRASFVEVYNGRAYDLLSKNARKPLPVRESADGEVDIADSVQLAVHSTDAVLKALQLGSQNRATASTDMNLHSSRSHAIFILRIEQRKKSGKSDRGFTKLVGRVNMVDLAGSEDISRSNAQGQRFTEAVQINTGLLQLHRVLEAVRAGSSFIPYRDSVLTRLLQDSLGGSSRAVLLAHISPLQLDTRESQSTLRYAAMAKHITNKHVQHTEEGEEDAHPMDGDFSDPEGMNRRTVFLHTQTHGRVFARVAGERGGRLVLLVHGSGPSNSSIWWNGLVQQLLTLD